MPLSPSLTRRASRPTPAATLAEEVSPSLLGAPERPNSGAEVDDFLLPPAAAPAAARRASDGASSSAPGRATGRIPVPPPVPDAPPEAPSALPGALPPLLADEASIAPDESYGADEKALNDFVALHPMLSMEATSHKTLQLVASMFERSTIQVADV